MNDQNTKQVWQQSHDTTAVALLRKPTCKPQSGGTDWKNDQLERARNYCQENGLILVNSIVLAGNGLERGERAIKLLENSLIGRSRHVVCDSLALGRKLYCSAAFVKIAEQNGIRVHLTDYGIRSDVVESFSTTLSDSIKAGIRAAKARKSL